jgi:hypothetical protein
MNPSHQVIGSAVLLLVFYLGVLAERVQSSDCIRDFRSDVVSIIAVAFIIGCSSILLFNLTKLIVAGLP